jgi:hypothetical protein
LAKTLRDHFKECIEAEDTIDTPKDRKETRSGEAKSKSEAEAPETLPSKVDSFSDSTSSFEKRTDDGDADGSSSSEGNGMPSTFHLVHLR